MTRMPMSPQPMIVSLGFPVFPCWIWSRMVDIDSREFSFGVVIIIT
jgi:hypothetical protein